FYDKLPIVFVFGSADFHLWSHVRPGIFEGVFDEVLKNLHDRRAVAGNTGETAKLDDGILLGDASAQQRAYLVYHVSGINHFEIILVFAYPGKSQQVEDDLPHPLGAVYSKVDVLLGAVIQLVFVFFLELAQKARYHPQGFLEVMRSDVGK